MAYLIIQAEIGSKKVSLPEDAEFNLGRNDGNDLLLPDDPLVSRRHCSISMCPEEKKYFLRDFSSNGTTINDMLVRDGHAPLADGDTLKIGGSEFVFCAGAAEKYDLADGAGAMGARSDMARKADSQGLPAVPEGKLRKGGMDATHEASYLMHDKRSAFLPGSEIGGYKIMRALDSGDTPVYLAFQDNLKRTVAFKVCAWDSDQEKRFSFKEAVIKSGKNLHPYAVPYYDYGYLGDICYVVMPFMSEGNLHERIRRSGPLKTEEAVMITKKIALAFEHAMKEHCIVHLVLDTRKIMFTDSNEPALLGLGINFWETRNSIAGKPFSRKDRPYMAPEQEKGVNADCRSDIYSLGLILFEMISGKKYLDGTAKPGIFAKNQVKGMKLPPGFNPDLVSLIRMMTADSPESRFQSWEAVIRAIDGLDRKKKKPGRMFNMA